MASKPRRAEPNHPPGGAAKPKPLDCTKCEGTGRTRTARAERDEDGDFSGAEVVDCANCGGTGKEPG